SRPKGKPRESKAGRAKTRATGAARKPVHEAKAAHRSSTPIVDVRIRWVAPSGKADPEAAPTGLRFGAPLDGMTLVDARARAPGIDLLWFESAPKRRSRSPLGSARLMAGSLRADGTLDPGSRVAVIDGDLEYGFIKDHRAPRLAGGDRG